MWGLVLLRLLIPVSFGESRLSVQNLLPGEGPSAPAVTAVAATLPPKPLTPASPAELIPPSDTAEVQMRYSPYSPIGDLPEGAAGTGGRGPARAPLDTPRLLRFLWALGAVLAGAWILYVNLRFGLGLRRSRSPYPGEADCSLPVYVTAAAETPCLFGLFHPAVYLTPQAAEDPDIAHILTHEYVHYRHGDHLWALLRGLALALHWFDPLVWWAAALSRRDGELACDEGTLLRLGEGERESYGRTLIRMTAARRPALFRAATTMTGGGNSLKERMLLLAKRPRTAALALVALVLLAALGTACTFTGAEAPAASTPRLAEDGRTILTLGAFETDSAAGQGGKLLSWWQLEKAVNWFNKNSREYLAEIRSYGDRRDPDALARLEADIAAGDMPDLLVTAGMPEADLGRRGLLLDLHAWYDGEDFFSGPLASMETEGRLYSVSSSIRVVTLYGLEEVLGRRESCGPEDLARAWADFNTGENAFIPQLNNEYAFLLLAALGMDQWADEDTGTCRFDSPEFLALLELCRGLPEAAVYTPSEAEAQESSLYAPDALCVKNRDALLGMLELKGEVGSVLAEYAAAVTPLDEDSFVFVGIPGTSPASAGCIAELPIGVSTGGNQAGAREFLDSLWDLSYRNIHEKELRSIPLKRSVLEDYIQAAWEERSYSFTGESGREYRVLLLAERANPVTQAGVDAYLALIGSASVPLPENIFDPGALTAILVEEARACFGGGQTPEETAANLQARCSAYLKGK